VDSSVRANNGSSAQRFLGILTPFPPRSTREEYAGTSSVL
jgi:hypothetical protein